MLGTERSNGEGDYAMPYTRSRYIWGSDAPTIACDISLDALRHLDDIQEALLLTSRELQQVAARAINRTLGSVRAECVRIAVQRYTAPARSYMNKHAVLLKATQQHLQGSVLFEGHVGTPLSNFAYSPKKFVYKGVDSRKRKPVKGPHVKILRHQPPKQYFGPDGQTLFFATTKKGFSSFWYTEHKPDGKASERLLRLAFGPSPIQALGPESQRIQQKAEETLDKRMRAEINYILQKKEG